MLIASISQLAKNYMITQSCMYLPYQISKVVSLYTSIQIFINTTGTGREGGLGYFGTVQELFHHVIYLEYFRKTCAATWRIAYKFLLCGTDVYDRLRSGHMTHEKKGL